jgi:glycogen debranching enzyme
MGQGFFSGWGIRTMAEGEGGYNPIEYHNGTVWPHDNSIIAAGLARYGFRKEAAQVAVAILEAATYFRYRLPEVFAGYPRRLTSFPVEYPTACSPQAWASAAPLLFIRVLLGLEPVDDGVACDPVLPEGIGRLALRGVSCRAGRVDVPD